ncbi:unnamed protein product [Triticum turgidum subsp. durum]|uniref:Uncharacterized protein n=1 Tax=Triticum turgidum subsp. durum TaxID=4567 RepID=A0A9R0Y967_TRITD|nr:unnamed protein product [Triticum turgidum subsp. durum]
MPGIQPVLLELSRSQPSLLSCQPQIPSSAEVPTPNLVAHRITYGMDHRFAVPVPESSEQQCEDHGLLIAEDGAVFLVAVGGAGGVRRVTVVCVRGNVGTGPVYSSSVEVAGPDEARRLKLEKKVAASCSAPVEFDVLAQPECDTVPVYPEMLHGEELHLCIRIGKTKIICS